MIKLMSRGIIILMVVISYGQTDDLQESKLSYLNFHNSVVTEKSFINSQIFTDSTIADLNQFAKWGYGIDLSMGYNIYTEGLQEQFKNPILFGLAFAIQYKKMVTFNVGIVFGRNRTKQEIELDSLIWKKNSKAYYGNIELSVAYPLLDNNSIKISPFIGLSLSMLLAKDLSPNADYIFDFEKNEIDEKFNFYNDPLVLGLSFDIKMKQNLIDKSRVYGFLRIKYAYNFAHFEKEYDSFNGNIHTITFGFGSFSRKVVNKI